jgi:electron transfer flavoprotein alpha subunit
MDRIHVLVEHDGREPDACSTMTVKHARRLALERGIGLRAWVCVEEGLAVERLVEGLARMGVDQIVLLRTRGSDVEQTAAAHLLANAQLPSAGLLLAPATAQSSMLAARIAARLRASLVADCTAISIDDAGRCRFEVATAGGMAVVEVHRETIDSATVVLMPLRDIDGQVPEHAATQPAIETVELGSAELPPGVTLVERTKVRREDMTLAEASVIVSGGKGLGGPEGFEPLKALAGVLGGHVGASRVATDLGWIDREHLVGMSGSSVRPALYLAIGISGAPHHLMGMRDATTIIALNTDESAPMMKLAHHAFVGDVNEVVPRLIQRLASAAPGGAQ